MSEMVERVARAIEVALEDSNIRDDGLAAPAGMAAARAAIQAMREPTEGMVTCLQKTNLPNLQFRGLWEGMWQAMIDAALK